MAELERRQERFCEEYVADHKRNQTQAAIRAGYKEKSARITASQLMKNPIVYKRIKELERDALEAAGFNPDDLRAFALRKIIAIANTDAADVAQVIYADDERRKETLAQLAKANNGQYRLDFGDAYVYIKPTDEWTSDERAAIKKIKISKDGVEIEQHDKLAALRILMDIDNAPDLNINLSVVDELSLARQRALSFDDPGQETLTSEGQAPRALTANAG